MKNKNLSNQQLGSAAGGGRDLENLNSKTLSKKFLFSLATVSVLATCANAQISGAGCSGTCGTVSDAQTGKITVSGTDNTSLTIANNGSVKPSNANDIAIEFKSGSSLVNFKNEGTIQGGSNKASIQIGSNKNNGVTITTFENSGIIGNGTSKFGITVWGKDGSKSSIENFNNSGTISSKKEAVYLSNTNIQTFTNSGTIQSNENYGVNIDSGTTIDTFTNSGVIKSDGNKESISGTAYMTSGVRIHVNNYIKTFANSGTISGTAGVSILGATIDNFNNTGIIESTSNHNNGGAIHITDLNNHTATIKNLTNSGIIKASNANGIAIGIGNKVETFTNQGTIEAAIDGITFIAIGNHTPNIDIGQITLESGSLIKADRDGIHIDGTKGDIKAKGIDVKSGSKIEGGNAGIYIGGGKELNTLIKISGEVKGGVAGIINEGVIGSNSSGEESGIKVEGSGSITSNNGGSGIVNQGNGSIQGDIVVSGGGVIEGGITNTGQGSISGSITVDKDSKLDSIVNTSTSDTGISGSITNNSDNKLEISNGEGATIGGGIVNNGSADLVISNQGSVGKDDNGNTVTNNGSGNVNIEDWVVSTDKETGKLETVVVGGSGASNVTVDKVTVDQGGLDLGQVGNINNIISGVKPEQIGNIGTNGGGEITIDFDPRTGKLSTDFNLNASIAGATFRSLINTTSRRASFIDSVMGNSMQHFAFAKPNASIAMQEKGNLYANASDYIKNDFNNGSYGYNKEHSLFILPYTSSQNVELSLNEESKGHTRGTIIGYSTLKDSGIYGVYVGYEDTKMSSTYFDINNRSYYTGLKYFNTLFTTSKGQEVYLKAQGKTAFIKNKLSKKIGKSEAEASPNSYAYGMSGDLGMNFNHGDNIFSPEAGLVYEGGYTEAFSMINTKGQATVMGGERTYANYLNLLSTRTSFTWFRDWLPNLKTSMTLGAKFNINPQVKAKARFGQVKVKDEFYLPRVQRYVTTSMIVPLNNVFYFSLNYNGMFDSKGDTHTGFAQFNYIW
ncbi:autotransporter outer membrane beta-barrel domain-containing protein [Campylobacter molothri]|uniref:autotransporter outer membrane beta-barrel domain-containing protein n=1 Tax=Campylobacter molothri TaxID=1032242 RepID=UPI003D9FDEF2